MSRRPSRSSSRAQTGAPQRRIAVFTEGEKTEPAYINYWYSKHREDVLVTIRGPCGVTPLQLVDEAIQEKKRGPWCKSHIRKNVSVEYWCVFDVDQHPHLDRAIQKAEANGIKVAISNPCIELWFVLHFRSQTAEVDRKAVQRTSKKLLDCGKKLTPEALESLHGRYWDAKTRAENLDNKHFGDGSPPRKNPSSNVWELIDQICSDVD